MSWAQLCVEASATAVESWMVISAVTEMSDRKYSPKKHNVMVAGLSLILAAIILLLNSNRIFSVITTINAILAAIFLTKFTSNSGRLFRAFAALLVYLAVQSVDYIVLFVFCLALRIPVTSTTYFSRLTGFGAMRCWFLLADKGIDLLLYILLKKQFPKLRIIHRNFLVVLVVVLSFAHVVTPAILSLVWSDFIIALQMAITCSWMLILVCVCIALCFSILTSKYQDEKVRNDLLDICYSMMEENYQRLYGNQQATARLVHDINHHMGVLRNLSMQHGDEEIYGYIDSLLKTHYKELPMCRSGNDIINAIINYKVGEAAEHHIEFRFSINADVPASFPPVDICAILANQIDNAFDACKRIDDHSRRNVDVHIWQNSDNLFLFQVSNSVNVNPLKNNPQLNSTKAGHSYPHGLGLKSISDTAEKYGGALENSYQDGRFYSTVFLNLNI